MIKQISIIGCGWLGLPLAKHLLAASYSIKGSTTSLDKIEILKSFGIDAFNVQLTERGIKGAIEECLSKSDILILNIPPGLRKNAEGNFVKKISHLIPYIENSSIKKVLFVSSTSVFADETSIPTITEYSIPNPDTPSGKQLLETEILLNRNTAFATTIVRFAGLFGADRHPAQYLSGKTDVKNPLAPVNLIHLQDCIAIIAKIIKLDSWDETFNASTTPHPTKKDYYSSVCRDRNLNLPEFDDDALSKGKMVDSQKLQRLLNHHFQVKIE